MEKVLKNLSLAFVIAIASFIVSFILSTFIATTMHTLKIQSLPTDGKSHYGESQYICRLTFKGLLRSCTLSEAMSNYTVNVVYNTLQPEAVFLYNRQPGEAQALHSQTTRLKISYLILSFLLSFVLVTNSKNKIHQLILLLSILGTIMFTSIYIILS